MIIFYNPTHLSGSADAPIIAFPGSHNKPGPVLFLNAAAPGKYDWITT